MSENYISVIIPMYNAEETITNCLNSVLIQLPDDKIEIIVVDDGSIDRSYDVVSKFIRRVDRSITLITQQNKGVSAARNAGIKKAKGDLIAFIDSDDIWLEGKLSHQLESLKRMDVDFVGTLHNNLNLRFPYKLNGEIFEITFWKLMIKMAPSIITAVFKRTLIEKSGYFDEDQKYSEDFNLWLRFSKHGKMIILNKNYAIAGNNKPLFGHSGLSGNMKGMFEGEYKNLDDMLKLGYINKAQRFIFKLFYLLKYYRRLLKARFIK